MSENILTVSDSSFESDVLKSDVPVLVDFWAEWCMPCRMLTPTIEKIAGEFSGKVKVGKVDTDKNRDVSVEYKISAIPTVMIFKGGQVAKKIIGLTNEGALRDALNEALK